MSRRQLLRSMDAQELHDWSILEAIDPFGQAREDARFALLSSVIANTNGAHKQDGSKYTPADFMLKFDEAIDREERQATQQSPRHIESMFRALVKANNAFWARKQGIEKKH